MPNLLRPTACLLLLGSIVGCTAVQQKMKPAYDVWRAAFDDETYVRFSSRITTRGQLLAIRDPARRRDVAEHEYRWAADVYRIANAKDATMATVRRKVEDKVLGSDFRYRAEADWMLRSMYDLVDARMTIYLFYATPPAQLEILCRFLRASSEGVMQATVDYRLERMVPAVRQIPSSRPTTQRGRT